MKRRNKELCLFNSDGDCLKNRCECKGAAGCEFYSIKPESMKRMVRSASDYEKELELFLSKVASGIGLVFPMKRLSFLLYESGETELCYVLSPYLLDRACDLHNRASNDVEFVFSLEKDGACMRTRKKSVSR
jgi:hypothetical protein